MLTLSKLKSMEPDTIINTGTTTEPGLHPSSEIRWVAKTGWSEDWAIYYHFSSKSTDFIAQQGEKVMTESIIRRYVPCDDAAFNRYRF